MFCGQTKCFINTIASAVNPPQMIGRIETPMTKCRMIPTTAKLPNQKRRTFLNCFEVSLVIVSPMIVAPSDEYLLKIKNPPSQKPKEDVRVLID